MADYSIQYVPANLKAVRGGAFPFRIICRNADGTLRDMTGETLRFRAVGNGQTISRDVTSFAEVTEGAVTEYSGADITLTEDEMRLVTFPMTWEADALSSKIVIAGGQLSCIGGANADGP